MIELVPYLALVAVATATTALAVLALGERPQKLHVLDLIALTLLVGFSGSRIDIGTDYPLYERLFGFINPSNWSGSVAANPQDAGFSVLSLGVAEFGGNFQALVWVVAVLTVVPTYLAIRLRTTDPTMSVFLYLTLGAYLAPFNLMRQGIAVGIVLIAALWLLDQKRNWLGYFALIALAGSLHATAFPIGVLIFFVRNWSPKIRTVAVILGFSVLFAGAQGSLDILSSTVGAINPRYLTYLEADPAGIGTYLTILAKSGLLALCWTQLPRLGPAEVRWFVYSLLGVACLIVGTESVPIARLDLYFSVFLILLVPAAVRATKSDLYKGAIYIAGVAYLIAFISFYHELLPYRSTLLAGF